MIPNKSAAELSWRDRARTVVHTAVAAGKLPQPSALSCVQCGKPATGYHHASYARERWLDVRALCMPCHRREDAAAHLSQEQRQQIRERRSGPVETRPNLRVLQGEFQIGIRTLWRILDGEL
jgi:hypothetical protein